MPHVEDTSIEIMFTYYLRSSHKYLTKDEILLLEKFFLNFFVIV